MLSKIYKNEVHILIIKIISDHYNVLNIYEYIYVYRYAHISSIYCIIVGIL